jgi:cysteine-S-conjugate beta-lyase
MIYNFDQFPNRRQTESYKWNSYPADVLPMFVADMDFISPEPVIRALRDRAEHGVFGYAGELPGLREVITARLAERYHWHILPEDILFLPGVVVGIHMAAHALLGTDGGILIQTPVYMPFLKVARNTGGIGQEMELTLRPDGEYTVDLDTFEAAVTPQTRMFLLCNPHNPVGRVFTRTELEQMAEICLRHNLVICSDEIHSDLVFPGHRHIPFATLSPEAAQNTITLMAPSKTFNVPGLQCAFAVIQNPELRRKVSRAHFGLVHGTNLFGLNAALAAYRDGQEWLDQLLVYLVGNRDFLAEYVNAHLPGMRMIPVEGTYLAWLDCRELGLEQPPFKFFLEQAGVALIEGEAFGKGGEGFLRMNFGCPRSMLEEALNRMRQALAGRR